ncbi:MAG TPA: hypothetical protein VF316_08465 [Polyangiaceae bacterium]
MHRSWKKTHVTLLAFASFLVPRPAMAFDQFEIQVYDGAASEAGEAGLELHLNYNHARHRPFAAPELSQDRLAHYTFEPSLGLTRWWEVGAYIQFASQGEDFYWGGVKLRSKLVTPANWHPHLRLGFNVELAALPQRFDPDRYGGELRPIIAWEDKYFHLAANPNVEFTLAGDGWRAGPAFAPAVAAYLRIPNALELGVEYYGSFGPMANIPSFSQQEHYVFVASNLLAFEGWELNVGVGAGLTPSSNDVIAKVIFGHAIGRLWGSTKPTLPARPR